MENEVTFESLSDRIERRREAGTYRAFVMLSVERSRAHAPTQELDTQRLPKFDVTCLG
jgi:hypothetical protein